MFKGQFELSRKLPRQEFPKGYERKEDEEWPPKPRNVLAMRLPEMTDFPIKHRINILEVGGVAGDQDILYRKNYSCSLLCYSQKGTVFKMKKEHFFELKQNEKAWLEVM